MNEADANPTLHWEELDKNYATLRSRSLEFRNRSTVGETPQLLGWKYKPNEVALPDRWVELGGDLYSGKVYRDEFGRDTASEILSMGLERLYKDPALFHSTDPEYFHFTVNSLRNTHQ